MQLQECVCVWGESCLVEALEKSVFNLSHNILQTHIKRERTQRLDRDTDVLHQAKIHIPEEMKQINIPHNDKWTKTESVRERYSEILIVTLCIKLWHIFYCLCYKYELYLKLFPNPGGFQTRLQGTQAGCESVPQGQQSWL